MTSDPPTLAVLASGDGMLVGALMALDRLVVATGLLVLLGGAGFLAVAGLPKATWRLTRRLERRAWWLLGVAWWATLLGTLAGLLLHGPFTQGLSLSRALDLPLLQETFGTRFGQTWAARVALLLVLAVLRVWSQRTQTRQRWGWWVAVGGLAATLVVTPALGGHAATGPGAAVGAVVGVVHFAAAAVWFGGLVLLGACVLPRADVGLLGAVPRFSSVAFWAMVVIVASGVVQGWRQLGGVQALGGSGYGRLLVAKVAVFVLLIAVAGRSRVLVRRRLTAPVIAGAATGLVPPGVGGDAEVGLLWRLRRLVLAEVLIAVVVLAVTALLGIATPPTAA